MLSSMLQLSCAPGTSASPWCRSGRLQNSWGPAAAAAGGKGPRKRVMRAMTREPQRQRLVDLLLGIPKQCRSYLKSPLRRALWGGIAILAGFYVALRVSISYGALPVNDWLAAAVFFLFTELVTWYNYSRPVITFPVAILNNFKLGFTYGLYVGALKL